MQFAINATRRLMFPVLLTTIVGGLWAAATHEAGRERLAREANELAQPADVEKDAGTQHDPVYMVVDDGSTSLRDGPT